MLILAGVSLNAVIGDNGIITQAQNATYMQSVAVLEEYLNSYYVEHYEEIESIETENKAEVLASLSESGNWFYKTAIGYVVDENGKAHYFLKIDRMPEEIKSQIKGGSSEGKTLADYKKCIDVYGVTKDLKVYYCSGGTDTIIGESYEQIAEDNPLREVFPAGSTWSKLIKGNDTENVTAAEMKSIRDLTIDENSGITNLSELYNFTSLKNLTINNVNMASLDGIENATQLQYVYLKNSTIGDYKGISKLSRLTYLYMERNGNTEEVDNGEVDKLFTELEGANLSNLQYFGIFGGQKDYNYSTANYSTASSNVTNISGFSKLGEETKKAIRYLYLNNNKITDLSFIAECSNVELLRLEGNQETTLNYLGDMSELIYLTAANMKLNDINVFASNSFSRLDYLNLRDNKELEDCSPLKNITTLSYLYLSGCSNLDVVKVEEIADFYNAIANKNIDSKYTDYLQGSTKRVYDNKNLTDTSEQILALKNMSAENKLKVKQISLVNNSQLTDSCLNEILGSGFTNVVSLDVRGCTGLKNLDFLEGLPNLQELLIDNTGIVGEEVEEIDNNCSKIATISINTEVDLTKMQKTISGLSSNRVSNYKKLDRNRGFIISENLVKQLEQCTQITSLEIYGVPNIEETIDLSGCIELEIIDITENTIKFILPEGLKVLKGQNYTIPNIDLCINTIETIQQNQMSTGVTTVEDFTEMCKKLSNSTSLKTLNFTPSMDFDFSGLKYLSGSNINTISITRNSAWFGTFTNMKNVDLRKPSDYIDGTPHFNNLKNLTLIYTTIVSMENFKDCTALENISITNSTINDISALANMPNLKTIDFSNNNIVNLEPIQSLNNLSSLNLSNNSIYNTYLNIDNLSILSNLNKNHSLKTLYLKGNNIDDYSQLDGLSWSAKDW